MLKSKKGQVTFFIILGIVIITMLGFLFYTYSYRTEAQLEKEVERINSAGAISDSAVKYYVSLCLKNSAQDGLRLLGSQGGAIYEGQGGTIPDNDDYFVEGPSLNFSHMYVNNTQIHYSSVIRPRHYSIPNEHMNSPNTARGLPYFPCECIGCLGSPLCADNITCRTDFENPCYFRFSDAGEYKYYSSNFLYPLKKGNESFREQLETFVENKTAECVEFENILQVNTSFDIVEGNPKVNVSFNDNAVDFELNFPVFLKAEEHQREITTFQYFSSIPVRLSRLFYILNPVINRDNEDFLLNFSGAFGDRVSQFLESGNLQMRKIGSKTDDSSPIVAESVTNNDIFEITDTKSNLEGEPFRFRFVRQNRYPAMDYLGESDIPTSFAGTEYDFVKNVGEYLVMEPNGSDLDEDSLTYHYSMWRENYTEWFNFSAFIDRDCMNHPERCTIMNHTSALSGNQPHDWTDSTLYSNTEQFAKYQLKMTDVGYHEVNVSVCDGFWCDSQKARVLVVSTPHAEMQNYNWYSGIPNNTASVEDPYFVQTGQSYSYFCPPITTCLRDPDESTVSGVSSCGAGTLFSQQGQMVPSLLLYLLDGPAQTWNYEHANAPDILKTNGPFNNHGLGGHVKKHENFMLSVSNDCGGQDNYVTNVTVQECISYRSEYASYPFHKVPDDNYNDLIVDDPATPINESSPFFANHTCCTDSGAYKDSSNYCYEYTSGICGSPRNSTESLPPAKKGEYALQDVIPTVEPADAPKFEYWNDFYMRNFTVTCDGERGNICNGTHKDVFEHQVSCGDLNPADINKGQYERCVGCGVYSDPVTGATTCKDVPAGTTFEYLGGLPNVNGNPSTGNCIDIPKCSDTSYNDVGTGEYNLYKATCDGDGNCEQMASFEECLSYTHEECRGDRYWNEKWGCSNEGSLPKEDVCKDSVVNDEVLWGDKACKSFTELGENYCDGAPLDNNADDDYPTSGHPDYDINFFDSHLQSCGPTECCNVDVGDDFDGCFDPCVDTGKDDECYSSNPMVSRNCSGSSASGDSCVGFSKDVQCQPGSDSGNGGFCDNSDGTCTSDLSKHDECETDGQCFSDSVANKCYQEYNESGLVTGGGSYCCDSNCVYTDDGNDVCKSTGYRIDDYYYCDGNQWAFQKNDGYSCTDDYQCQADNCVDLVTEAAEKCCSTQLNKCQSNSYDASVDCSTYSCDGDNDCGDWVFNKTSGSDEGYYLLINGFCKSDGGGCECQYHPYDSDISKRKCYVPGEGVVGEGYVATIGGLKKYCKGGHTWVRQSMDGSSCSVCASDYCCNSSACSGYNCNYNTCRTINFGLDTKCCSPAPACNADCNNALCDEDSDCQDFVKLESGDEYKYSEGYCEGNSWSNSCTCDYNKKNCSVSGSIVGDGTVNLGEYCMGGQWYSQKSVGSSCDEDYECMGFCNATRFCE